MAPVISGRNLYNYLFNTKLLKKMIPDNPTAAAANLALISTVTKDALNCYYYTNQSYHNKEIPDNRRLFVSSIDVSNGIVNVAIPIAAAPIVKKYTPQLFERWFGKHFNAAAADRMFDTLTKNGVKCAKDTVHKLLTKDARKLGEAGFGVIAVLVFSQIFCKRVVTPTLATPLADVIKKQFEKYEMKHGKGTASGDDTPPTLDINTETFDAFQKLVSRPVNFKK